MRFSIKKDLLKKAIDVAILATDKKEQDIRSTFLFDVQEGGNLVLWATDRQLMAKVPTTLEDGTQQGQGQFTVEAARLDKWIKNVRDEVISVDVEERTVTMTCGSAKGHFASKDPVEFPNFQAQLEDPKTLFDLHPDVLVNALKFVSPFIGDGTANNSTANNMQVAELRGREMIATDSISVSLYMVSEEVDDLTSYAKVIQEELGQEDRGEDSTFKIGNSEIRSLVRFLEKTCATKCSVMKKDVFLVESDDGSIFGYNAPIYTLPQINGIPKALEEPEVWVVDKSRLQSAVNTLTATADPEDVSLTLRVSGEGLLTLAMKDALDRNECTYQMPITREKSSQDSMEFVINWERLVEPLSLYDGDEVTLGIGIHEGAARYLKYYERTSTGDVRVCLVTMRTH